MDGEKVNACMRTHAPCEAKDHATARAEGDMPPLSPPAWRLLWSWTLRCAQAATIWLLGCCFFFFVIVM